MWLWKLLLAILSDQRGEGLGQDGEGSNEGSQGAEGDEGAIAKGDEGDGTQGAGDEGGGEGGGEGEAQPPKYGEFGETPTVDQLYEAIQKLQGVHGNLTKKTSLTESNLSNLRKSLATVGLKEVKDEQGNIRLELDKQSAAKRERRFNEDAMKRFSQFFNVKENPEGPKSFMDTLKLFIQDLLDDYSEEKERTGQERSRKMQALMSEKAEIEELMTSYFPQLDPQYKAGKPTNSQFNQAFYDRATEIWKEQYKSHPLQQLRAALRAAQELNIIPQAISKAKKEGFEAGKKDKKILGPVKSGAQKTGKTGPLSREEYLALSPEKKEEHDAHQVGV